MVKNLIACLVGAALPLAFAPFGGYPLAILCPALLLLLWLDCTGKQGFWRGLWFGIGFFGVGISWVYISIHEYGNTDVLLATFITALFVLILALFPAIEGYVLGRFFPRNNFSKLCLAFPSLWVLLEWVHSWLFTGFPWLLLGASQTNSPLHGFAPIVGEYGLSFLVTLLAGILVFVGAPLVGALPRAGARPAPTKIIFGFLTVLCTLLAGLALSKIEWTKPTGNPIQVSLIQGNIPQELKWDREYLETTLNRYYELTQQHWDSRIIIWPEAAIPLLQKDAQSFIDKLDEAAKQHNTTVVTGIPIQDGFRYYNGMIAVGVDHTTYYKRHLVPFGEYVPFENLLRGLIGFFAIPMSDFSAGPAQQPKFHVDGLNIAPFICYEVVYPAIVLSEMPQAQILVTLSNDAWFGRSFASAQHLQIGQLMAQATGRYLIFSTNDGITAIVTPQGKIAQQIPRFKVDVLTGNVTAMTGSTPWIVMGDTPIIILMFVLVGIARWRNRAI